MAWPQVHGLSSPSPPGSHLKLGGTPGVASCTGEEEASFSPSTDHVPSDTSQKGHEVDSVIQTKNPLPVLFSKLN